MPTRRIDRLSHETGAFHNGLEFLVTPGVYEPAEDTFLLANNLDVKAGERVLEIGTGCGILAILAAKAGAEVTATDVNPLALDCAKRNAAMHGVGRKIDFRLGDLFGPAAGERFDLVIFNPPYLPASGGLGGDPIGLACEGGGDGRAVIDPFLDGLPDHLEENGRVSFVQSSLSDVGPSLQKLRKLGFLTSLTREKLWFEELCLVRASWR